METIKIAEYTIYPGGRKASDGAGNGENFRKEFLLPILSEKRKATIDLDGVFGYPSSFLEEAFGGLVREDNYTADQILDAFCFESKLPNIKIYIPTIINFIEDAHKKKFG